MRVDEKSYIPYKCQWCGNNVPLPVTTDELLLCPICTKQQLKKVANGKVAVLKILGENENPTLPPVTVPVVAAAPTREVGPSTELPDIRKIRHKRPRPNHCIYCDRFFANQGFKEHVDAHIRKGDKPLTKLVSTPGDKPGVGFAEETQFNGVHLRSGERELRDHNKNFARQ